MTAPLLASVPWHALAGGGLIGLAAAVLLLFGGRIAGISGIVGGLLVPAAAGERGWRLAFLAGLLAAVPAWAGFAALPRPDGPSGVAVLIAAGLLVGFGTRLAGGCTSGHGVCGLARGSRRSAAATAAFMAAGMATVYVARHVLGAD